MIAPYTVAAFVDDVELPTEFADMAHAQGGSSTPATVIVRPNRTGSARQVQAGDLGQSLRL